MRKTIIAALTIPALLTVAGCQEKAEVPKEEYVMLANGAPLYPGVAEDDVVEDDFGNPSLQFVTDSSKVEIARFYNDFIEGMGDGMRITSVSLRTDQGHSVTANGTVINVGTADDETFSDDLGSGITATAPIHTSAVEGSARLLGDRGDGPAVFQTSEGTQPMDVINFYADAFGQQGLSITETIISGQGKDFKPTVRVTIRNNMDGGNLVDVETKDMTLDR